ncbi:IQ and AAA domain-containing protein 1-like [Hylaeus anthracinus]|uniref:IQ and AAA domain-containing protein 1-like n=1 Tax=Hylaeus anthracinus TaxID=313031 RepID=UPI0023B8E38C|nr:IQ and AAA domain-containing protein 1-like [Hylaeus anthracinus]
MSEAHYNELWLITRNDLNKLLELDRRIQQTVQTKIKEQGLNLMLPTYLRYVNLVKRLIVCHDQMVQTQKRELIKRVLDCAVGRMLEYKRRIVDLDFTDYQWPDDFMNQFKYTPDDVEITVSACGKDVVQQRRKRIEELIENAHKPEETPSEQLSATSDTEHDDTEKMKESIPRLRRRRVKEESKVSEVVSILQESPEQIKAREARIAAEETMRNAILLIQSHERARVHRCIATQLQQMNDYKRRVEIGEIVPRKLKRSTFENAARTIQRAWRRYVAKKANKKRIARLEELLGMTIPSWKSNQVFVKDRENFQKKLDMMSPFAAQIDKTTEDQRTRLWKIRGPGLIEDITDEIREWFIVWYNEVGHLDVYPAANLGGSVLIATGQTQTPQEYLIAKTAKKDTTEQPAKIAAGRKKNVPWVPATEAFNLLDDANQDFIANWSFRDESDDSQLKIYGDLITDKLCYELQLEMRKIVDELMRLELRTLNQALRKDYKADNKELAIPKQKRGKKRGKKKKKDPLGNVPVENIFHELAKANIIRNYPLTSLNDWVGDLSYQNYEAAREFRDYRHRLGEIKQVMMENCVLPLSSKEIHRIAPLVRSVCICGLARYGKSFLVDAICSEVGAVLFDMTPTVLVGKYVGRRNEQKLINMISKVAREFAPAVIFIDNGEKPWGKKIPSEERQYKPKRFARYYPKLVKSIKRGDQILFLTTSSEPYKATRPFIRVHDKFIMIPLTDYNTLYMFYKDLLMKYHGVHRDIDVSSLAKMSEGIPLEFIKNAIETVLNVRRRITLRFNPLTPVEIMEEVFKYQAPTKKSLGQFAKFETRTPLGRKRARLLRIEQQERQRKQKAEKKR